ncbi:MAG: phage tail protein [Clostridia bacterium]|nr:phage tail protein [Clostridia bacterium]
MAENKVRFGLKNVYYALLTEAADSSTNNSFGTPKAVPGAVSMTMDSNGTDGTFYADNVAYYKTFANNGYTGSLEMARITDEMLEDVWGMTVENGILTEKNNVQPKPFALMFQISGDKNEELYVLYRVVPTTKPSMGSETVAEQVEPGTQTFDFEALPLVTGPSYQAGKVFGRTVESTSTAIRTAWFTDVQIATTA